MDVMPCEANDHAERTSHGKHRQRHLDAAYTRSNILCKGST